MCAERDSHKLSQVGVSQGNFKKIFCDIYGSAQDKVYQSSLIVTSDTDILDTQFNSLKDD